MPRTRRAGPDRGTATAELAVVMPSLLLLAALGMWAVLAVAAYLRCVDAAGSGVRALARGESAVTVRQTVLQIAPRDSAVQLESHGDLVSVEVRATVRLPGPWAAGLPSLQVGDRAVAVAEQAGVVAGR